MRERQDMDFKELMQRFADKFGIGDINVQNDTVAFEIDGMVFGFIHNQADETITVVADLGHKSINADGVFGGLMLQSNFLFQATKGATIFQNPENDAYGIEQMFRLVDLDADALAMHVERLANIADDWRAILSGCMKVEKAAEAIKAEHGETIPLASDDFMRV